MGTPAQQPALHGGATLQEVATELGISKKHARQLEKSSLRKLRGWCKQRGLRPEALFDLRRIPDE